MIKTFSQFLLEEEEKNDMSDDAQVSSLMQEIDRNYNSYATLATAHFQEMNFLDEVRDWPNFTELAEIGKDKTAPCKMYMKVDKGAERFEVQLDFDVTYRGVENWDKPEFNPANPEETERIGVSLENLKLTKIQVKSGTVTFAKTTFSKDLGKTTLRFLVSILKDVFDIMNDEALNIRQL